MKKVITLILAGIIACSISACSGTTKTNSDVTNPAPEEKSQSVNENKAETDNQTSVEKETKTEDK